MSIGDKMKIIANNYKANETFKFIRQGLDLTQEELAKNIKASKSSIEKYEYGTVNYTFETLLKIADKYDLNLKHKSIYTLNYKFKYNH